MKYEFLLGLCGKGVYKNPFFYLEQEGRIKREHYKPVRAGSWVLVLGSLYGFIKSLSPEEGEG